MKSQNIVSPLYDFAFAEIFGNQQNISNTVSFLKTLLDIPEDDYDRLTVVSPILRRLFHRHKMGVVDLKLTTKSGRIIHIELQVDKKQNMRNRILYYICRLVSDQLNWGDDYKKLHQVISIVICDHNMMEEERHYINQYELKNERNNSFTNMIKLVILELPKLSETEDSDVWRWLRFLKCKNIKEFEMLGKKYPDLEKPIFCAKKLSLYERWRDIRFHKNLWKVDERMREEYLREEAQREGHAEGKAEGHAEGKAEGLEIGSEERNKVIARNLIAEGSSSEFIHKITGLSFDEISKL
ncbi:MAG: Rpn family recombination-promoting nuclease/putative transposase [Treponema sp.]|jgi:predicted transposase/invertase (TIGR01784 family)|nr:Rpn family recombination-promoting nuclease/putative transposase [Treponema sp.]